MKARTVSTEDLISGSGGLMQTIFNIESWHYDRNLVDGTTHKKQLTKLDEEVDELKASIAAGTCIMDDVGDICVVLINHCLREGVNFEDCLYMAYLDIKDRTGKMVDGVYVKDAVEETA